MTRSCSHFVHAIQRWATFAHLCRCDAWLDVCTVPYLDGKNRKQKSFYERLKQQDRLGLKVRCQDKSQGELGELGEEQKTCREPGELLLGATAKGVNRDACLLPRNMGSQQGGAISKKVSLFFIFGTSIIC